MQGFPALFLSLLCFTAAISAAEQKGTAPSTVVSLKSRQPNWRPQIVQSYPNGNPERILFFDLNEREEKIPVKQQRFYNNGVLKNEMDLTIVQEDSPGFKEWKSAIVPQGISVSFFSNGKVEKIATYEHGLLHGELHINYPSGQLRGSAAFKDGQRHGPMISYHEDGSKAEEGTYKEGKLVGEFSRYTAKGVRTALIPYENGVPHGNALEWYDNGALKASRRYTNGLLHSDGQNPAVVIYAEDRTIQEAQDFKDGQPVGTHSKYHPNSKESYKVVYRKGQKQGKEQYFAEDGRLIGEGEYKEGQKIGKHWKNHANGKIAYLAIYDANGKLVEPIVEYSADGQKLAEYSLVDDARQGAFREWYPNAQIKTEFMYVNGKFEGKQQEFYLSGKPKMRANYKDGLQDGMYEEWYENGQPAIAYQLASGIKQGECKHWYENGQLALEEHYLNGMLNGARKEWHTNGVLKVEGNFAQGKRQDLHREWNEANELIFEARFDNDLPEGLVRTLYGKSRPKEFFEFVHGKQHGKSEEFYENGQRRSLAFYKEGQADGTVQTWYQDGTPWLVKNYRMGIPAGEQIEYFPKELSEDKKVQKVAKRYAYNEQGKLHGEQKTFYPNGVTQTVIAYDNGELQGVKALWDAEGNLVEESWYEKSKLDGRFYELTREGREIIYHYKNNKKEGPHAVFYAPHEFFGKVKALEVNFVDDKAEGELSEYNEAGTKIASTFFHQGLKDGPAKVFSPQGHLFMSVEFKNDKKNGSTLQYFPNGKIFKESVFVEDLKEGEERTCFENGKLVSVFKYTHGELDGLCSEWNAEGVLVFEGEYKQGKRHGKFNKFFDDGKPRMLQTFINDQLHGVKKAYDRQGVCVETRYENGKKVN